MILLGFDIGSSSLKAGVLRNGKISGQLAHVAYPTHFDGVRAEVNPSDVLKAIAKAIALIGPAAKKVDCIAATGMSPSWVAMDAAGRPLTPIVTHQDRRSIDVAREIEAKVGKTRCLNLSGNRPVPGGISSTTWAWFLKNEPSRMARADLVGHLNTFLIRTLTGGRAVDPSNASFMGVYATLEQSGWNDELCDAVSLPRSVLPEVIESNRIGGRVTKAAARKFGLSEGTPMLAGMVDTSAAMLLAGAKVGQLLNVSGSTDVLALCTDQPKPGERLLTRAFGIGKKWMQVCTLAAAGSSVAWTHANLFADLPLSKFYKLLHKVATRTKKQPGVRFDPYLAGERTSIEQRSAAFTGLTLATTRDDMLAAVVESLAWSSAERIDILEQTGTPIKHHVVVSGGLQESLSEILHRDWPGRWKFHLENEATLRGLALLEPRS